MPRLFQYQALTEPILPPASPVPVGWMPKYPDLTLQRKDAAFAALMSACSVSPLLPIAANIPMGWLASANEMPARRTDIVAFSVQGYTYPILPPVNPPPGTGVNNMVVYTTNVALQSGNIVNTGIANV